MAVHPEMEDGQFGDLIRSIDSMDTVEVWCISCQKFVRINATYAKYVKGEIQDCGSCRKTI